MDMRTKYILLPIDGSATAEAAARFAEDIARAEGSTILVLGVEVRMSFDREGNEWVHQEDESIATAVHEYLTEQVAAEAARIRAAGVDAEEIVLDADSPYEGILETVARRGVSMIVMGTHGRTGLARAVIGSVADRVVRHSTVPVVLVPLKDED